MTDKAVPEQLPADVRADIARFANELGVWLTWVRPSPTAGAQC